MGIIKDLKICCSIEDVLKVMKYNENNPNYNKVLNIYNEMYQEAESLTEIKGIFKLILSSDIEFYKSENKYFIPCLLTLGNKISEKVTSLFNENEPFKAYTLNIIADLMLFNASKQMIDNIDSYIKDSNLNINISEMMSQRPDGENSLNFQKEILNCFNETEKIKISITETSMLNPVKSMAFYLEGDKNIILCRKNSQCNECNKINCDYKNNKTICLSIRNKANKNKIEFEAGLKLLDILLENSIEITAPCNGVGKCGKCKIKVIDGFLEITKGDKKHLSEYELKKGIRLACYAFPKSDLEIELMENDHSFDILTDFSETNIKVNSRVEVLEVSNFKECVTNDKSLSDDLNNKFHTTFKYSLNALRNLGNLYENDKFYLIKENNFIINICKENRSCYGIAIDIGTTTIAMKLINLITGKTIGQHSVLNPQKQYGADVISRIQYANNKDKEILTNVILNCIDESINTMCNTYNVLFNDIYNVAISGNTTMLYFLLGLQTYGLANNPFKTIDIHKQTYEYGQIFNTSNLNCKVTILPCVSAYIGGDIVSGLLSHNFYNLNKTVMLIDIGTNGEIAIGNKDKIYCVSTAAGPAFEGVNISDGIGSVDGAIAKVYLDSDNKLQYETINNLKPVGICGSGVVDIVSVGLSKGWIESTGRMIEDSINIVSSNDRIIKFTKKDVREVQLAKAAIRTGIDTLIDIFECSYDEIDEVLIAGGFGSKLNIDNSIKIGLFPPEFKSKVKLVGNSSLNGGIKFLIDRDSDIILDEIIEKTKYIELANRKDFSNQYIKNIGFN